MSLRRLATLALALTVALASGGGLAGCGLKGALSLPEKSGNVVIRGASPTTAPATPGTTTDAGAGVPAETGTAPPTETSAPPVPEKMPPPELPHSNAGASR
jgi:predicted small lipoprotein YifL